MAGVAEVLVFLGTLSAILIIFNVLPGQYNAKLWMYLLFHVLTILVLLVSLGAQRFSNLGVGLLAFAAAIGAFAAGIAVYKDKMHQAGAPFTAAYLVLQTITIVLVFGSAGLGGYS